MSPRLSLRRRPLRPGTLAALVLGLALPLGGCATSSSARLGLAPPATVPSLDLNRYLGTWYEIASFPQSFQEGCVATTATYSLREDGDVRVFNRCRDLRLDGPERTATGRARLSPHPSGARLKVSFFWPFWGDYWVLELGEDYEYAVVGDPSRDYLWILSRTPTLDEATYEAIVARLTAQGYEIERLRRTPQATHAEIMASAPLP